MLEPLQTLFLRSRLVTIDSRTPQPGAIFFGLQGEKSNGGQYAPQALEQGAALAVVDRPAYVVSSQCLLVNDALRTLQNLASWYRSTLHIPIVAITGTNGKTTTKELLHTTLSSRYRCYATEGNLNNQIGVPLTLLRIPPNAQIAIVEMGASHPGDIKELCQLASPTHGLITSIGLAHLEGFGSPEGVQRTKGELFEYLKQHGGTAFVRTDDPSIAALDERLHIGCSGSRYSLDAYHVACTTTHEGLLDLTFTAPSYEGTIHTQLVGSYNAINAVAALHLAYFFNVPLAEAAERIAAYTPSNHRSQLVRTARNTLILDAYNANPSSMAAALEAFKQFPAPNKRIILGAMRELGQASPSYHQQLCQQAESIAPTHVLYVGREFEPIAPSSRYFCSLQPLKAYLVQQQPSGCTILVKGSHSVGLEAVADLL